MNDFIKDTTEIPSLSFGAPEPEPGTSGTAAGRKERGHG